MNTATLSADSLVAHSQVVAQEDVADAAPVLRLRLKKPKNDKKVGWREGTVDNEHMGKKKSKCCCIYKKPTAFGESSSEDDEECENCFGHPEKRRRNKKHAENDDDHHHYDENDHHEDKGEHKDAAQSTE